MSSSFPGRGLLSVLGAGLSSIQFLAPLLWVGKNCLPHYLLGQMPPSRVWDSHLQGLQSSHTHSALESSQPGPAPGLLFFKTHRLS